MGRAGRKPKTGVSKMAGKVDPYVVTSNVPPPSGAATGHRVIGRPWAKGVSPNPLGGKVLTPEVLAMRKLTREDIAALGSQLLQGNITALDEIAESHTDPAIRVLFARVLQRAWAKGDHKAMVALIEQIVGKAPVRVDMNVSAHAALVKLVGEIEPGTIRLPDEEEN